MVGAGDPDGDKAPTHLELSLVGRQKWKQLRPSVIGTVVMILELVGLGVNTKQGGLLATKVSELVPSRIQNQMYLVEEPDGWSRTSIGLGWLGWGGW